MNKDVQAAVKELLEAPTQATLEQAIRRIEGTPESDRRLAMSAIEDFVQRNPDAETRYAVSALVALRRIAC